MKASITSYTDVISWARKIIAANGSLYTPLTKSDQYIIASALLETKRIEESNLDIETSECTIESLATSIPIEDPHDCDLRSQSLKNPIDTNPSNPSVDEGADLYSPKTNGDRLREQGCLAQKAFDAFLLWADKHPLEKNVMNFATGETCQAAAFAYWLGSPCEDQGQEKEN